MSDFNLNGQPIFQGNLEDNAEWTWTAHIVCDGDAPQQGDFVSLEVLGTERAGTVVAADAPYGKVIVSLEGGRGKLDTEIVSKEYQGCSLDFVIADILRDAGETPGDLTAFSSVFLPHWIRARESAVRAIKRLLRLRPTGTSLKVNAGGNFDAIRLTWATELTLSAGDLAERWVADDAAVIYPSNGEVFPGVGVDLDGVTKHLIRVDWQLASKVRTILWFEG